MGATPKGERGRGMLLILAQSPGAGTSVFHVAAAVNRAT